MTWTPPAAGAVPSARARAVFTEAGYAPAAHFATGQPGSAVPQHAARHAIAGDESAAAGATAADAVQGLPLVKRLLTAGYLTPV